MGPIELPNDARVTQGVPPGQEISPPKEAPSEEPVEVRQDTPTPTVDLFERREEMREFVQQLSRVFTGLSSRLEFGVIQNPQMLYVRIVDKATNETVKVLPMPELLELRRKLTEMNGVLLDRLA